MAPVCAVVVAGGSGQRFGNPGGKQLVNVAGRPLMSWSIRAFDRSDKVGHIVVVCPAERRAEMRRLAIDPFDYDTPIEETMEALNDLVKAGKCVIMVSSELPEILAMSDHVVVMRGGRVMADIDRDTPHFNSEDIMKAAWGGELD